MNTTKQARSASPKTVSEAAKTPRTLLRTISLVLGTALSCTLGCNTLTEMNSMHDSSSGYSKEKNAAGETVYRRTQVSPAYRPFSPIEENAQPIALIHKQADPVALRVPSDFFGALEASSASAFEHLHLGAHLGYSMSPYFEPRLGVSFFASKDFYAGFDLSARAILPLGKVKPFLGIGGYAGDTKKCSYGFNPNTGLREESCEKKFLSTGYVEAGIEAGSLSVFVRDYSIERAGLMIPTPLFFGIGLRL